MSKAKILQESVWITSIIIPPKVRVRRKRSIIPLFLESPHHLLVPNRIVRWLGRCHVEKWAPVAPGLRLRAERDGKTWATIFGGSVSRFGSICLGTYETKWEIC